MCLAVPARILSIEGDDPVLRSGRVDLGGISKEVNLAFVPEAEIGDHVLVHVGVAIAVIDEEAAARIFATLDELGALEEEGLGP